MFGKEPAVGKNIYCKDEIWYIDQKNFTVGGVYKDFPENAQMKNSIYIRMKEDWGKDDWYSQNFMGYILLDSPESRQEVEDNFNKTFDFSKYGTQDKTFLHLIPVTDIYYTAGQYEDMIKAGNIGTMRLLVLIALLIIIIAGINMIFDLQICINPKRPPCAKGAGSA